MKARETGRRKRKNKDRLGNRLAVIGISVVVLSLAVVVNVKNTSMEKKVMEYQAKEEALTRQKRSGRQSWRNAGSMYRPSSISRKWPSKSWVWSSQMKSF